MKAATANWLYENVVQALVWVPWAGDWLTSVGLVTGLLLVVVAVRLVVFLANACRSWGVGARGHI
jgi:hypothetical protein